MFCSSEMSIYNVREIIKTLILSWLVIFIKKVVSERMWRVLFLRSVSATNH